MAWQNFTSQVLTPAFPDGFTVFSTVGQWFDPGQKRIMHEDSFVVVVLGHVTPRAIAAVSKAYRNLFHQEAVGVVTSDACAVF